MEKTGNITVYFTETFTKEMWHDYIRNSMTVGHIASYTNNTTNSSVVSTIAQTECNLKKNEIININTKHYEQV